MVFRQFSFHSIGWCVWWMQIAWKWRTTQFNRNKTIITVHSSQVRDESQGRKDTTFSNRNGTMEQSESDSICVNTVSLTLSICHGIYLRIYCIHMPNRFVIELNGTTFLLTNRSNENSHQTLVPKRITPVSIENEF